MKSWGHPFTELHERKVAKEGKKFALCEKNFWVKIFKVCVQAYIFIIDTNSQLNLSRGSRMS